MTNQDHSYKKLFSHKEMVEDLLRGFVHEDWVSQLDFSTLEPFPAEHVTDCYRDRRDDLIWRVRWKENWLYIYLLLEFQSTIDCYMAVRIMGYVALLYQDIIQAKLIQYGDKLPPVLPVVIYNGSTRWNAEIDVFNLICQTPRGLEKYRPKLSYLLLDEGAIADSELVDLKNFVAALVRFEKSRTVAEMIEIVSHLSKWLSSPSQDSLRRAFTHWFGRVFKDRIPNKDLVNISDLEEVKRMLEETIAQWPVQWKAEGKVEGIAEGIAKGMAEERRKILSRLIDKKFGETAKERFLFQIESYTDEDFDSLCDRVLDAKTTEELFG
ncbi:MAG: Rpn family recombination-promoting nuclease/putative transposase [Candidatus Riflebacteria bacterium]|nr:Rpn family recombination-promoting nuclease/putative transposase [Candidatus Riflebacteria bacterium]